MTAENRIIGLLFALLTVGYVDLFHVSEWLDGGHFFNGLGNMGRYVLHEDRSLLDRKTRQEAFLTGNGLSDWDRFAMITYTQYARSC